MRKGKKVYMEERLLLVLRWAYNLAAVDLQMHIHKSSPAFRKLVLLHLELCYVYVE